MHVIVVLYPHSSLYIKLILANYLTSLALLRIVWWASVFMLKLEMEVSSMTMTLCIYNFGGYGYQCMFSIHDCTVILVMNVISRPYF